MNPGNLCATGYPTPTGGVPNRAELPGGAEPKAPEGLENKKDPTTAVGSFCFMMKEGKT